MRYLPIDRTIRYAVRYHESREEVIPSQSDNFAVANPGEVLWRARGVVEAPVDEVVEQLFLPYEKNEQSYNEIIELDRTARTIAVAGHWWYRGVTRVEPHERGSLVTFELQNIAQTAKWAVAGTLLQARMNGTLEETRTGGLPKRLAELGEHFGCRTELLSSAKP